MISEKSQEIVLGEFHLLISFHGYIGSIMEGSGLGCALDDIYGANAVKHMLSGKAIARANRGHILVERALMLKLQRMVVINTQDIEICGEGTGNVNLEDLHDLYTAVRSKVVSDHPRQSPELEYVKKVTETTKNTKDVILQNYTT